MRLFGSTVGHMMKLPRTALDRLRPLQDQRAYRSRMQKPLHVVDKREALLADASIMA